MSRILDGPSPFDFDGAEERPSEMSRRQLLRVSAGAGAILLATGTASADESQEPGGEGGRGGQAMVAAEHYREKPFEILRWTEPNIPGYSYGVKHFDCGRPGKGIYLVGWVFEYVDEDTERVMYTRDNRIDQTVTYEWSPGGQDCPQEREGRTYLQTGYAAGESRQ